MTGRFGVLHDPLTGALAHVALASSMTAMLIGMI
jgi:hypothetical protein